MDKTLKTSLKIGIYSNLLRDKGASIARILINQINKHKSAEYKIAFIFNEQSQLPSDLKSTDIDSLTSWCDILIVIGGDGTVLNTVKYAAKYDKPILGINAGNLGFLAQINSNVDDIENIVSRLIKSEYTLDERVLLKAVIDGEEEPIRALNEIVVCRDEALRVTKLKVYIDGTLADEFTGDGVMVATPTGSTAYSLSCSGPVLSPNVNAFIINAICPHILHGRPIVVDDKSVMKLEVSVEKANLIVSWDGQMKKIEKNVVGVTVMKSKRTVKLIKLDNNNFYNTLLKKLNYAK